MIRMPNNSTMVYFPNSQKICARPMRHNNSQLTMYPAAYMVFSMLRPRVAQ